LTVFLRELEYYQGILFLTTNRVGKFDDAFVSRIHVVLHYPGLTKDDRWAIWELFFDKLEAERSGNFQIDQSARRYVKRQFHDEEKEHEDWKWNGREIRNGEFTKFA
jgi:hypothetical protein